MQPKISLDIDLTALYPISFPLRFKLANSIFGESLLTPARGPEKNYLASAKRTKKGGQATR